MSKGKLVMFDIEKLKDKIVMAFATDEFVEKMYEIGYEDDLTAATVKTYYVFDTAQEFIKKWKKLEQEGEWYQVFDQGKLIVSGCCEPGDIDLFKDYWGLKKLTFNKTFSVKELNFMRKKFNIKTEDDLEEAIMQMIRGYMAM